MARIGTTLVAGYNINITAEVIHNLAFTLVTPLTANYRSYCHINPVFLPKNLYQFT